MLNKELKDIRALGGAESAGLPPHLAGLPDCLHKYGPLFEQQLDATASRELPAA